MAKNQILYKVSELRVSELRGSYYLCYYDEVYDEWLVLKRLSRLQAALYKALLRRGSAPPRLPQ